MAARKSSSSKSTTKRKRSSSRKASGKVQNHFTKTLPGGIVRHPDETNRRDDSDVTPGRAAVVTAGEHKGRRGVIYEVATYGKDGFPDDCSFKPVDAPLTLINVRYKDLDPIETGVASALS